MRKEDEDFAKRIGFLVVMGTWAFVFFLLVLTKPSLQTIGFISYFIVLISLLLWVLAVRLTRRMSNQLKTEKNKGGVR